MDGAVEEDDSGDNQSAAQPGATASLREPSRANVPDLCVAGSASSSSHAMEQPIVVDDRAMDAEPGELDVGALVDALLGEMRAVTRYALSSCVSAMWRAVLATWLV